MRINKNGYFIIGGIILFGAVIFFIAKSFTSHDKIPPLQDLNQVSNTADPATTKLHGIIIERVINATDITLLTYNPDQSITTARQFSLQGFTQELLVRQAFNKDYTQLAVSQNESDGSSDIGYLETSGKFTNLTPQTSDYSGVQQQTTPVFNPVTGRLWFSTPTKLGSVDPTIGPSSSRLESFDSFHDTAPFTGETVSDKFAFTPDGKLPIVQSTNATLTDSRPVISPDGQTEIISNGYGFKIANSGTITDNTPLITAQDNQACSPQAFIDNNSFVCTSKTQVYKVTISSDKKTVTTVGLLPNSNKSVWGAIADPSGKQIAFIAQSGSVYTLYTIPSSGNGQPQKVTDVDSTDTLLSWEQ